MFGFLNFLYGPVVTVEVNLKGGGSIKISSRRSESELRQIAADFAKSMGAEIEH